MTNNDILRSFRYALELDPSALRAFFAEARVDVPLSDVAAMLKDEQEAGFFALDDAGLSLLLDGVVAAHRGHREGADNTPERLTNNRILRALRIAFTLRDTDILSFMHAAGREVTKAELGALFRREDHRNYQPCGDQFLRAFLRGLGLWHRQGRPTTGTRAP